MWEQSFSNREKSNEETKILGIVIYFANYVEKVHYFSVIADMEDG